MEKLLNGLDIRNDKITVNGEEFFSLPVALNEKFSWVVCEWQHLSEYAQFKLEVSYNVNGNDVDYCILSTDFRTAELLTVHIYIDGVVHSRSIFHPNDCLKDMYTPIAHKITDRHD